MDHLNVRLSFGRFRTILTSPQYHRIHHAADASLANRNFAAIFPMFDVIFGTYPRPGENEYPASGLMSGEEPSGALDLVPWPFTRRRQEARQAANRPMAGRRLAGSPTELERVATLGFALAASALFDFVEALCCRPPLTGNA